MPTVGSRGSSGAFARQGVATSIWIPATRAFASMVLTPARHSNHCVVFPCGRPPAPARFVSRAMVSVSNSVSRRAPDEVVEQNHAAWIREPRGILGIFERVGCVVVTVDEHQVPLLAQVQNLYAGLLVLRPSDDDLRALVGQQHGAIGAGQHLREIDDTDSLERSQGLAVAHLSPQWLRRLISTERSPSKTCLSSWFTP